MHFMYFKQVVSQIIIAFYESLTILGRVVLEIQLQSQ